MATMVKEKRREKKKVKEKPRVNSNVTEDIYVDTSVKLSEEAGSSKSGTVLQELKLETSVILEDSEIQTVGNTSLTADKVIAGNDSFKLVSMEETVNLTDETETISKLQTLEINNTHICESNLEKQTTRSQFDIEKRDNSVASYESITNTYEYLNERLDMLVRPNLTESVSEVRELELCDENAYLKLSANSISKVQSVSDKLHEQEVEDVVPSAPEFEENAQPQSPCVQEAIQEMKLKLQSMPLEMAVKIYAGTEMDAVKAMSEREEAIVEAGPISSPDHPLVDLLSTFRSSLRAVDNESSKLACGLADEEKSRSTLWKIEKRNIYQMKECRCGARVELRAVYEYAELSKERLPVARLRLESLLRDIQDSYCHYQHAALLTHCQIEEFISETAQSNKGEIREALSLVLQALRMSDGAAVLSAALRRWAAALSAALVDERDVRQILFLLHHLFRQSRSVRWAARVFSPRVSDATTAARTLALLDTLMASPRLEAAVECTEALLYCSSEDEAWEEVSARGAGGAVREGALREIDLLALLHAFPLRDLVARLVMFTHADIRQARPYEWGDATGGREVIRASCGVRALLAILQRAALAHPHYARLISKLRTIAAASLEALACLYQSPRAPYLQELEEQIVAELEACFTAGFVLFGTRDLHLLTTTLLAEHTAKDYCFTLIVGLHDKSPKQIESLGIEVPGLSCDMRVRMITQAAVFRDKDHELARIVLDFLFQTGAKIKSTSCKIGCVAAARECLGKLIAAHPYLRTVALHTVANLTQVESMDPSIVDLLQVGEWRPQREELQAVLHDWSQRCPLLLQQLLLQLDCTPYTGISLEVQLALGGWLCALPAPAARWRVLLRLRTHRACWNMQAVPAADVQPTDLFSSAFAVLAGDWGSCIPLICSAGVEALCSLAARPREAVHCLAPVMLVMAHSPESLSLTPKFPELFNLLLNCGPTLVQRALGRGPASGQELLLRLALSQIEGEPCGSSFRVCILSTWLHALWRIPSPAAANVLDIVALAAREWPTMDAHAALLLQEENAKELVANAVRNVYTAPLLCECLLRAYTQREDNMQVFGAVANILWEQRINNQKIHVDNALQKVRAQCSSDSLAIYVAAAGAAAAPDQHPAHLLLWRQWLHLYLQRPPHNMRESAVPVGPLFYSGLIKTRTLSQIKKRLQETAAYHNNEAGKYKIVNSEPPQRPNRVAKSESITIEQGLLPALSIKDFTGESSDSEDSEGSSESEEDSKVEEGQIDSVSEAEKKRITNMACYHTAAERMVREFHAWLDEGDRCRASPHHADIARFIPEQALEEAWKSTLARLRPPPSPDLDEFPHPTPPPSKPPDPEPTPLDVAVKSIMRIKDKSGTRSRRLIKSPIEDIDFTDSRSLLAVVDKHLKDIDQLGKEWFTEVSRISSLDTNLWELISALRVPRPLPPVTKACPNTEKKCKPLVFHVNEREWCISTGAERGIKDNRSSWRVGVRRLARARPHAARNSAALHSIARRLRSGGAAVCVVERAWRSAAQCAQCAAAQQALSALVGELAERWICQDGRLVSDLISRWCCKNTNSLQQTLCGLLISPRRMEMKDWPLVYTALLNAKLPSHTIFSYLSKFEMSLWSQSAPQNVRRDLLDSLLSAHIRFGPSPASDHSVLLELIGVHTTALINDQALCASVVKFARAAVDGKLPARQWTCVVRAAGHVGQQVGFDQLGHLLRELGVLWWDARSHRRGDALSPHASHVAALLRTLVRAVVRAALALTYGPERVGRCAWSAALEAWGAWLSPRPAPPPLLQSLPPAGAPYSPMLKAFVECLEEIMCECPGSSEVVLQQVFEWCTATHMASQAADTTQESRVQAAEMLAQLAGLPWDQVQWFYGTSLQTAVQMCATNDRELMSWGVSTWKNTLCETYMRDVTEENIVPRLASILYLFTGTSLLHTDLIIKQAIRLPWWKLPTAALGDALDRFFAVHHNPSIAYHDVPQFELLLFACELKHCPEEGTVGAYTDEKRSRAVSQWTLAAAAPPLLAHVASHTRLLLNVITELGQSASTQLEELLTRASVMMCMEPAAAAALPEWQRWVASVKHARVVAACVSCACALTALPYCAALADAAIRAYMRDLGKWGEVVSRWSSSSPWREAEAFASRACAHAAYACAASARAPAARAALVALRTLALDFVEHEVILAVWICYACRIAKVCSMSDTSDATECVAAAQALLSAWAQPPRRSILRVVTMQPHTDRPTALHQLLCRLAQCILTPSTEAVQAYEAACSAAGNNDVITWGRTAKLAALPTLAVRLYPKDERYFQIELEAAEKS